jgi:hypothetical protein
MNETARFDGGDEGRARDWHDRKAAYSGRLL